MNNVVWLFLSTPLPWLAIFYALAYRHDLSRIARPFRDSSSPREWWSVCNHLGVIGADVRRPSRKLRDKTPFVVLLIGPGVSLLQLVVPNPLDWYHLVLLQVLSAFSLLILLTFRLGPLPSRPYKDMLPYPRLGTRIRHLKKSGGLSA